MASIFDLIDPAVTAAPTAKPGPGDLFDRGLRAGAYDASGQLNTLAGTAMDAVGLDGSGRRAASAADRATAEAAGRDLVPLSDVNDVSSGLRWAAGAVGRSTPQTAAALGAGLLTSGGAVPAILAGTAAAAPFEIGGQLQAQAEDPANAGMTPGQQLAAAAPYGLAAAGVQSIVPAGVAGRMLKSAGPRSFKQIGLHAAADVPAEGLAEGGAEGIRQVGLNQLNPNARYDTDRILAAGAEGAALGGVLGGVGATAEVTRKAVGSPGQLVDKVTQGAKDLGDKVMKGSGTAKEAVGEAIPDVDVPGQLQALYKSAKGRLDGLRDKVADGKETADLEALNAAGDDVAAQAKVFEEADRTTMQRVQEWGTELLDSNLSPEKAAQVKQWLSTAGDKASQMGIAGMKRAKDAADEVRAAAVKFRDRMVTADGKDADPKVKKSEDYSGAYKRIGDAVRSTLGEDHPALQDADTMSALAEGLRPFIERVGAGKAIDSSDRIEAFFALNDVLGDNTTRVLKAVHDAVGKPSKDDAAVYSQLNQMNAIAKGRQSLLETLQKNLRPELQGSVRVSELKLEAEMLGKWARDNASTPRGAEEAKFRDTQVRRALAFRYGDKVDSVLKAVEKGVKADENILNTVRQQAEADLADPDGGTREGQFDGERTKVQYYSQNKQLYLNPAKHGGVTDKDGKTYDDPATQRMKSARKMNPRADVRFVKASELGMNDPMVKAKYADLVDEGLATGLTEEEATARADQKIDDYGVVAAEAAKNATDITSADLDAMRLNAAKYGSSPARIDAGEGVILDATRVTSLMHQRMRDDYTTSDDLGARFRAARMFKEGIAAVQDLLGRSFEIADTTQITRGKPPLTWGEAQKLDARTEADKLYDKTTEELARQRKNYKNATPIERENLKKMAAETLAKRAAARDAELTRGEAEDVSGAGDVTNFGGDAHGGLTMNKVRMREIEAELAALDNSTPEGRAREAALMEEFGRLSLDRNRSFKPFGQDIGSGQREVDPFGPTFEATGGRSEGAPINVNADGSARDDTVMGRRKPASERQGATSADYVPPGRRVNRVLPTYDPVSGERVEGGPPSPKALAAKKAAFLEKARSGDPELLQTLATSEDAKGLQRAAALLNEQSDFRDSRIANTLATINARLAELVTTRPGVAYALQTKKYSLMAEVAHANSGKPGFAATHDSPLKHEGRFDWRAHSGRGEGAAAFGAGTYLSTGEGVHKYYKGKFTAMVKPEYEYVAAERISAQLHRAVGARTEIGSDAAKVAAKKGKEEAVAFVQRTLDEHFKDGPESTTSQAEFDKWTERYKKLLEAVKAMPESEMRPKRADGYRSDRSPTYEVSVDIAPEQLLDWDKKLSEQHPDVERAIYAAFESREMNPDDILMGNVSGKRLYRELAMEFGNSDRAASELLQKFGILGHTYAAANGRDTKTPNYVIYDDSKISVNYVHFDKTRVNPGAFGPQDRSAVEAYLAKVAPEVQLQWADILHAGEFEQSATGDIIRLSVHALNPTSVAYHEALHAFFARLRADKQSDIAQVIERAASSASVTAQLRKLLEGQTHALKQLSDPEERAAYMYQFWAAGRLNIGPETKTMLQRVADFIRKITGMWTNDQQAERILEYFHSGDYASQRGDLNAVRQATMESATGRAVAWLKAATEPLREMGEALASAGGERLRDTGIPALRELANTMKLKTTSEGDDPGYLPAARSERSRLMNQLAKDLKPYSEAVLNEALEAMQNGTTPTSLAARNVAAKVQTQLQDALRYMQAAGVRVSKLGMEDGVPYFPRAWDAAYISSHQRQFLAMMEKYVQSGEFKGDPRKLMQQLMVTDGAEFNVETDMPGMQHTKTRTLKFISHSDAAQFMRKDLFEIMNSYLTQATRRAEWARRFGDDGSGVTLLLQRAATEGATPDQIDTARKFIRSVDGTLGDTINPTARRMMGNVIVYQNVRLLPLAIFSSVVDAQGLIVRGGTVGEAFTTLKRGLRETIKNFQKNPDADDATQMAEALGTVDSAMLTHTLGAAYSQGMVGSAGRVVNDTFFRYNLLEQWNRSMRVGATEAAMGFIKRHATAPGQHSKRFLRELGLEAADVELDADGRVKTMESDGLSLEHAARMKAAVNRWVDGAILRSDAVDKPLWMSDPHWALVSHLKQFVFAFQETILKRVVHEARAGNYAPGMALASYVPMMMAADMVRGLIQGHGDEPPWKRNWTAGDYVWSGVERAGLFGVGQFGIDVLSDVNRGGAGFGALTGPTIEQLTDALQVAGGREQFGSVLIKSLPANALYAAGLKGEATDPAFSN